MGSQPGTSQPRPLLARPFDDAAVSGLRHEVTASAVRAGLAGQTLDDFIVAVNELVNNAVRHGGGRGELRLWQAGGQVVCEVRDQGSGITGQLDGGERPSPLSPGGWGLWLARRLTAELTIDTGPAGTTVRIWAPAETAGHQRRG